MKVIAKKGARSPKEDNPREYIGDDVPQEVPETAYYMRLIDDGSLVRFEEAAKKDAQKGGKK